jgi:hypothetical protein
MPRDSTIWKPLRGREVVAQKKQKRKEKEK